MKPWIDHVVKVGNNNRNRLMIMQETIVSVKNVVSEYVMGEVTVKAAGLSDKYIKILQNKFVDEIMSELEKLPAIFGISLTL